MKDFLTSPVTYLYLSHRGLITNAKKHSLFLNGNKECFFTFAAGAKFSCRTLMDLF